MKNHCISWRSGAARFLTGLAKVIDPQDLTVIVNTGDDINLFDLHISPDVDIVTYTLAGIVDEAKGWGIKTILSRHSPHLKRWERIHGLTSATETSQPTSTEPAASAKEPHSQKSPTKSEPNLG